MENKDLALDNTVKIKKNRLLELDAFRGIAAILVVLFHFTRKTDFGGIFEIGATGVDLFFMISGFVIFLTLKTTNNWKDFTINRLSRLFPTYWICVTLTFFVKVIYENLNLLHMVPVYLANLTMFQLNVFKVGELDTAYWTLTIEMVFYIFMVLVFQFKFLKNIQWIGLGMVLISLFNGFFLKEHYNNIYLFLNFRLPLIGHFPIFYSGIMFYNIKFNPKVYTNYFLLLIAFLSQWYLFNKGGSKTDFFSWIGYGIILFSYYAMFFVYSRWGLRIVVNRITVFFGTISYSLYLIHGYIGQRFLIPWLTENSKLNRIIIFAIALSVLVFMAVLINTYIEKPAMKFIRNRRLK